MADGASLCPPYAVATASVTQAPGGASIPLAHASTEGKASRMSDDAPSPVVVVETVARPPAERPPATGIDDIAEWLVGPGRLIESGAATFDEFAWRLLAAGMPVLRVTLHVGTIHPQFLGTTIVWWRDTGRTTQVMVRHEIADALSYAENPVRRVVEGRETLHRRLDRPDSEFDFSILPELRDRGGTEYLALPVEGAHRLPYMLSFVTDRPGGFEAAQIEALTLLARRLGIVIDRHSQQNIIRNLLNAYLGGLTAPRVLAGQIRRGSGIELNAVLWLSDLRAFTERSDRLPGERMIAIMNALFDAQAAVIGNHGGEILKFIGDGLLAIFPIADTAEVASVAREALAAAHSARTAVRHLAEADIMADEPPLEIVVALHVGTVIYGNIGAADRLDFTVMGPAVNLVSRLETMAKTLDEPIVVSADFAAALGAPLRSLGPHPLRGLATPQELFAPGD
jgi:adenylate cyclase